MKAVGIRELKNRLSAYLRAVRAGETVLVTDRGEVVAELRPSSDRALGVSRALERAAREGRVRLGEPNRAESYARLESLLPEGEAARLLEESRSER